MTRWSLFVHTYHNMSCQPSEHKEFDREREKDRVVELDDTRTRTFSFPEPQGGTHALWSSGDTRDCLLPFWRRFNVVIFRLVLYVTNIQMRSLQFFTLSIRNHSLSFSCCALFVWLRFAVCLMRTHLRVGSAAKPMSREGDNAENGTGHVCDEIVFSLFCSSRTIVLWR